MAEELSKLQLSHCFCCWRASWGKLTPADSSASLREILIFRFNLPLLTISKCNLDSVCVYFAQVEFTSIFRQRKRMFYCAVGDPILLKLKLQFTVDLYVGGPVYMLANCEMSFNTNLKVRYSYLYCKPSFSVVM